MINKPILRRTAFVFLLAWASPALAQEKPTELPVDPPVVQLRGPSAVYSLLVSGKTPGGQLVDLTHEANYQSAQPKIARVTSQGVIRGGADGKTEILVEAAGRSVKVQVEVQG